MIKRFLSYLLVCILLCTIAAVPAGAVSIDVGGGSTSAGSALSTDNMKPNEYNAVKVSKISGDGKTLHKQWIIRKDAAQTPSTYIYFKNSHKVWHKQNPGKDKVPSAQTGTSGFNIITDSTIPLTHSRVNGALTTSTNFATSIKSYFKDAIKNNIPEAQATMDEFTAEGGFYIFEPLMSIVFGGKWFMGTPSEYAKLDIAAGGTASAYSPQTALMPSYTNRQAPELAYAESSYTSIGITGGKPAYSTGSGNSGRWRSPTILSSALGFGVVSGTGQVKKYTISYNKNGGSGSMSSGSVDHGKNYTIKSNSFTRSGHSFTGWKTASSSGTSYGAGGTISNVKKDIMLYAQWIANRTISFNANGGTGTMSSVTVTNGSNYTIKANGFSRSGYTFTGWRTGASSGTSYGAGATISNVTSNITLYAQWVANRTISFNANGGTGTMSSVTVTNGSSYTIKANGFSRTGYRFIGWKTAASSGTSYSAGGTISSVTSNITLYAQWQIITYTVIFDLKGGTRTGGGALSQTVNHGSAATAPTVWKDEHFLVGWDKAFNNVTSNLTVNAIWQELPVENLTIQFVTPNADYKEGTEVLSTYRIYNGGSVNARPRHNVSVSLSITYPGGSVTVPTKTQVVCPRGNENYIYFKWRVPAGTAGKTFKLVTQISVNGGAAQDTDTVNRVIAAMPSSQTPKTEFEAKKPSGWVKPGLPGGSTPTTASWYVWEYVLATDSYTPQYFGTSIANTNAAAVPDPNSPSKSQSGGVWTMRSGYGLSLKATQGFSAYGTAPGTDAYTHAQSAIALFPEFGYSNAVGKYRSLQNTGTGVFEVLQNTEAKNSARLHFTPIWFPDGDYNVQTFISDVWTPAGMLYGYFTSNAVKISGSAFDDWYVARN